MSPERLARINAMLDMRQPDLTICMEQVHKTHNLSAMVRTADAIGIHEVHAVWPGNSMRLRGGTATGSQQWVKVNTHRSIQDAIAGMREQGMQIIATHLSDKAVDFREVDYTKPTAILMGQEKTGITAEALALADQDVIVPMVGMVQSLNVSVATALLLYEAQRQRQAAGMYGQRRLAEAECQRLLFEGGHPIFAKICRQKGLPYPQIDDEGQIQASEDWWQKVQMNKSAWEHLDD
ncbi:tRNA (guanosine(18)-2'-O)-methyltransferase TrmH [Ferrimonas balearica]|uniref:tRNA (guanosine(18)-2'-O)-methyltransferase TrmH n=1 Tax=Ferrimonas balearica TaxID=44012 RepID=UPI001C996F1D|nr:tRNA (guanosine(18)-2'-O)-methyltransferase TrmH [Ferrimonas balearica]MBY5923309.1 tRNA (guanosine(18)-2'-O)-methyltransferase TrmH [Ferrimonas balearica]MBY5995267.1 tRNA (guanosine(18)-2'-O)-methyltransferase TrmH [Ferrimonas balearica]